MLNLVLLLTITAVDYALLLTNLHGSWAIVPWLIGIAVWAAYFRDRRVDGIEPTVTPTPIARSLVFIIFVAAGVRLYRLNDVPLGFNVDELFTLNNTLLLLEKPFDFFGHTPLISEGWVETPNLYLYFNLLILKVAGVSYW